MSSVTTLMPVSYTHVDVYKRQELGWIKLREGYDPLQVSEKDVAVNVKKIKLIPLEAAQLPRSLEDTDYSFVNGNFALASGLKLTEALAVSYTHLAEGCDEDDEGEVRSERSGPQS